MAKRIFKPLVISNAISLAVFSTLLMSAPPVLAQDPFGASGLDQSQRSSSQGSRNNQAHIQTIYLDPEIEAPLKLDELDYELLLYESEAVSIDAKKRAVAKKLYEDQELQIFRKVLRDKMRNDAVGEARLGISKLSPDEIRVVREFRSEITEAENTPLHKVEHLIRTENVPLTSNEPLSVYVSPNNQSSVVFFDSVGNPWPIAGEPIYNKESFSAFKTGEKEHIVVFTITREFSESNAMINLKGLDIPIPIKLIGTEYKVDTRLSARVPKFGPLMSEQPSYSGAAVATKAPPELLSLLNGEHVSDSLAYDITSLSGDNLGQAYYRNGQLYVRSRHELIIPGPTGSSRLLSGQRAFIAPAREDLLLNVNGRQVEARLTKVDDLELTLSAGKFEGEGN
jgi:hypothetical protein